MKMYKHLRTIGWNTAALILCGGLYAQTDFRRTVDFREETSPTITFQELQHVVPRRAREEMEKAYRAKLKHNPADEIDHLRKAVLIDPEYIAARNNLGVCLLAIEPASAIVQLEEGIRINPHKGALFNNLAVGYTLIHDLWAAELAARKSIELDRTANSSRALLGAILYDQQRYSAETLALLERGCKEYPVSHIYAASVLMKRQEFQKARVHIQAYLSSGETEHRWNASEMLDIIDHADETRDSSPDHVQDTHAGLTR